jgi:hypothetical protein
LINTEKRTAIITSCTAKKLVPKGKAIEMYHNTFYNIYRRWTNYGESNLDLFILSGKYGLIRENDEIEAYNTYMDISNFSNKQLDEIYTKIKYISVLYDNVIIALSNNYKKVIKSCDKLFELEKVKEVVIKKPADYYNILVASFPYTSFDKELKIFKKYCSQYKIKMNKSTIEMINVFEDHDILSYKNIKAIYEEIFQKKFEPPTLNANTALQKITRNPVFIRDYRKLGYYERNPILEELK